MVNPYEMKGPEQFWRTGVANPPYQEVMPIRMKRFTFADDAVISTAGSCFAQHIAKHLKNKGTVKFLETEEAKDDQPVFSALYGNIYTVRQLVQLFDQAFSAFKPAEIAWKRADNTFVDCFRPFMFTSGFASPQAVATARDEHLCAVRRVFTECTTFIFTLGLTECWISKRDGSAFPVAPGVVTDAINPADYAFHNLTYDEVLHDSNAFIHKLRGINPTCSIILTVSPVPLTATYTDEHVLVAATHSKAILRAICSVLEATHSSVYYFPSFEIISGSFNMGHYYNSKNKRTISSAGVDHVMRVFDATYFNQNIRFDLPKQKSSLSNNEGDGDEICDEDEIIKKLGF